MMEKLDYLVAKTVWVKGYLPLSIYLNRENL
jgi:hypothetical protein